MESWRYAAEGKGLLFSDEIDLSIDSFGRSRKAFTGWDGESVEGVEFIDFGFSEVPKRPFHGSTYTGVGVGVLGSGSGAGIDCGKIELTSPSYVIASNSSLESGSNHSNSIVESSSQDSSLIDLKLGRLVDGKNAQNSKFLKERSVVSSVSPTSQAKRARTTSTRSQTPFCQVYGCNKDLSSLKEYHKRHKVCEVHSKTPKVIVNGVEQRFCQQCSRFHLLVEFDDGKRSCRKRLAGHNERRRKPQFGTLSGRSHTLLQSYQASTIQELAGMSHSSCALSLLSAESQDLSHSTGIIMARPLNGQANHSHHNVGSSDKPFGAESLEKYVTNGFHSSGGNPLKSNHMGSFMVSCGGYAADIQVESNGFLQDSNILNAKYCASGENGSTVDLLQLSSHLHRVEQQRNSAQVKQEIEDFSTFLATYGA